MELFFLQRMGEWIKFCNIFCEQLEVSCLIVYNVINTVYPEQKEWQWKMDKSVKRFYGIVMLFLLVFSFYPIGMGVRIFVLQSQYGNILPEEYAQHVIPYAAVCSSILVTISLYPIVSKIRRFSVPAASIIGLGLFAGVEWFIEKNTINTMAAYSTFQWQLTHSVGITDAMHSFHKLYDPTYRMHHLLVSFLLILLITGTVYNYGNVMPLNDRAKKAVFCMQAIFTVLFIVFCAAVNITHFFNGPSGSLAPFSSVITGFFFVLAGVNFGIYLAVYLINKNMLISILLPAAGTCLITLVTYLGEYRALNGVLYRFGYTKLFQMTPFTVMTLTDMLIVPASGLLTALLVYAAREYGKKAEFN